MRIKFEVYILYTYNMDISKRKYAKPFYNGSFSTQFATLTKI